ncbi:MAG: ankyrin repeat domain-containing protein [Thioalkalispiraceae bacterium]|jgi:hypothetical protein
MYLAPKDISGLQVIKNYLSALPVLGELDEVYRCQPDTCPYLGSRLVWAKNNRTRSSLNASGHFYASLGYRDQRSMYLTATSELALGADPNVQNPYSGDSVYTTALISGYDDIAAQLVAAGARRETLSPEARFQVAANQGNHQEIHNMVSQYPALLQQPTYAQNANPETVALLISLGFDVNHQDETGKALLHYMAANGNLDSVRYLVEHGAREDLRDKQYDGIPLGWAHFNQQIEENVSLLLERGAH